MNPLPETTGWNVRGYHPREVVALARLFTRTVREVNARDYSPEQIDAWAPEKTDINHWNLRLRGRTVLVAESDSDIVGFVAWEADGHLDLLYVDYRHQRRGIGTALCRPMEKSAVERQIPRIYTEASITARPFFEAMGFKVVAPQTVTFGGMDFKNFRMEKFIH